jgi:hypothetical protein
MRLKLLFADVKTQDSVPETQPTEQLASRTGRLSCQPLMREAFFAARREHLSNFFTEQGPAAAGDRSSSARAAVSTGDDTADFPISPTGGRPPTSAPTVDRAAVVALLQAEHTARGNDTARSAPRYYGGTKYLQSDFDSSGREGGSGEPPTTAATPTDDGRVAAAASLFASGGACPGALQLDTVGLLAGHAPPAATLGPRRTQPKHVEPAAGG